MQIKWIMNQICQKLALAYKKIEKRWPKNYESLTLFMTGIFGAAHGWRWAKRPPLPKICDIYPTIMKLGAVIPYLRKIQKVYQSRDTPLEFCWHQHFFTRNQQVLLYQTIRIKIAFWYIISNSFNISWVFEDF